MDKNCKFAMPVKHKKTKERTYFCTKLSDHKNEMYVECHKPRENNCGEREV
ncbi:MAG: hypothetical protein IJ593_11520 [Lachnospiraceae bacterium]|nr:hypothetical protein [Lachnospiraceae bacterium]